MAMSKSLKVVLCACMLCAVAVETLEAKKSRVVQKSVYMIGVGISFTDSAVFVTDMMQVDSITLEKKRRFLMDRQLYSFQLQRYLEAAYKGGPYTTAIYSGTGRKAMERRYLSLHKRYSGSDGLRMVLVDQGQFRFKPEKYVAETADKDVKEKTKRKGK